MKINMNQRLKFWENWGKLLGKICHQIAESRLLVEDIDSSHNSLIKKARKMLAFMNHDSQVVEEMTEEFESAVVDGF